MTLAGSKGRVAALCHALAHAGSAETDAIASALIQAATRGGSTADAATDGLILHWARLSEAARNAAGSALAARLPGATRRMLASPDPHSRQAALSAASQLGDATLLTELAAVLLDPARTDDHAAAVAALAGMAQAPDTDWRAAGVALRDALDSFERHRCGDVVQACAAFVAGHRVAAPARAALLDRILSDREHPGATALRARLRGRSQAGDRSEESAARAAALTLLRWDPMKSAALERIALPARDGEHAAMLSAWHLISHPVRRRRLARLSQRARKGTPWLPGAQATCELPADARRGLIELAETTLGPRGGDAVMARLLLDSEPGVRHAAVRALARRPIGSGALHDLCFDADPRIARSAAIAALSPAESRANPSPSHPALSSALARSPHPAVRALIPLTHHRSAGSAGSWPALHRPPSDVLNAAALQGADITPTVARHAAVAATILGRARSPDAELTLRHALHIRDARVRANAMESLVHVARPRWTHGEPATQIVELLMHGAADAEHRIRANSIRGLILAARGGAVAPREGPRQLCGMLDDPRPMHRIAGLWLVERLAPALSKSAEVLDRVNALAHAQANPAEHARAASAAQRLMGAVRSGWANRAAPVELAA